MRIPAEILGRWNELKEYGDVKKLAGLAEESQPIISDAFSSGECSESTFKVMTDFYAARIANREKLINEAEKHFL